MHIQSWILVVIKCRGPREDKLEGLLIIVHSWKCTAEMYCKIKDHVPFPLLLTVR